MPDPIIDLRSALVSPVATQTSNNEVPNGTVALVGGVFGVLGGASAASGAFFTYLGGTTFSSFYACIMGFSLKTVVSYHVNPGTPTLNDIVGGAVGTAFITAGAYGFQSFSSHLGAAANIATNATLGAAAGLAFFGLFAKVEVVNDVSAEARAEVSHSPA